VEVFQVNVDMAEKASRHGRKSELTWQKRSESMWQRRSEST